MFFFNQSYGKPCQKWLMLSRIVAHPAGLLKQPLLHPIRLVNRDPYNGLL